MLSPPGAGATAEEVVEDSEMGEFVQPTAFAPGGFSPAAPVKDQGHGNDSSGAGAKVQAPEEGEEGALGDGDDVVEDDTRRGGGGTEYEDDRLARVSEKISSTALIVGRYGGPKLPHIHHTPYPLSLHLISPGGTPLFHPNDDCAKPSHVPAS